MASMFHCLSSPSSLVGHYKWRLHHDSEVSRTDCPSLGTEQRVSSGVGAQKQVVNQETSLQTDNNLCVSSSSFTEKTDDDLHSTASDPGEKKFSNNNKLRPSNRNKRLRPEGGPRGGEGRTLHQLFVDQTDAI